MNYDNSSQEKHKQYNNNNYWHLFKSMSHNCMFGIIARGDKQYKIIPGEACEFEKIEGKEGDNVILDKLIMLSDKDNVATLEENKLNKYNVNGKILKQYRDNKVIVFKKKRRKDYTRKRGHRQYKTLVLIDSITLKDK